jgi:ABC-type lipoprotein export system ATPase subunit
MSQDPLVKAIDVSYVVSENGVITRCLDQVSAEIVRGSLTVIQGPSGSGKSSLLNALALLERPTSGAVIFDGVDASTFSDAHRASLRRTSIGFVFQSFHLLHGMTNWENVILSFLVGEKGTMKDLRARALHLLDLVGLAHRADDKPSRLSGGEKQRVAIARALAADPQVVLADEPTGALDSLTSSLVLESMLDLTVRAGRALVVVTHDPDLNKFPPHSRITMLDGRASQAPS